MLKAFRSGKFTLSIHLLPLIWIQFTEAEISVETSSSSAGGTPRFSQADLESQSRVFPGALSRRHQKEMPKMPQLAFYNVEEQWLVTCVTPWIIKPIDKNFSMNTPRSSGRLTLYRHWDKCLQGILGAPQTNGISRFSLLCHTGHHVCPL